MGALVENTHGLNSDEQVLQKEYVLNQTCQPDTNATTTGNLSQDGSESSYQGQEVGHTLEFPLFVYIVNTSHGP